ncbi:hypothetical protein AERO9A_230174 [Aeromonas salmonicida]|nr:hypothetical protein AERO9A_230174 [Aeromonas salmonicida]
MSKPSTRSIRPGTHYCCSGRNFEHNMDVAPRQVFAIKALDSGFFLKNRSKRTQIHG